MSEIKSPKPEKTAGATSSDLAKGPARVLFVLGAGASVEFGSQFPLGGQLKDRIGEHLRNELPDVPDPGFGGDRRLPPITAAYVHATGSTKGLRDAMNQIMHSVHDHGSIDDLLNDWRDRPDMQLVAKIAIALIIATGEQGSELQRLGLGNEAKTQQAFTSLSRTWLGVLTRSFLKDRISRRNLQEALEHAVFVNFNYDRSVERFLFYAFVTRCQLSPIQAIEALARVRIIHPYGSLGPLKLDRPQDGYGLDQLDLSAAAYQIRTYNEQTLAPLALAEIRDICKSARRTYLLGFGFHRANVDLLFGDRSNQFTLDVSNFHGPLFATGFNLLGQARARAEALIKDHKGELSNVQASQLMADHAEVLEQLPLR